MVDDLPNTIYECHAEILKLRAALSPVLPEEINSHVDLLRSKDTLACHAGADLIERLARTIHHRDATLIPNLKQRIEELADENDLWLRLQTQIRKAERLDAALAEIEESPNGWEDDMTPCNRCEEKNLTATKARAGK